MEIGEFHWANGVYFKRLDDGFVRITRTEPDGIRSLVALIPAAEWASIIASMSARGEAGHYYEAVEFHMAQPRA